MLRTQIAICAAMTTVGLVIGVLVGLSESPVVGVVLPLLFGLIGGGSGLFIAQTDLTKAEQRGKLVTISASLVCLSLATLGGTWFGMRTRNPGTKWRSLEHVDAAMSAEMMVERVLLEARLARLGLSPADRGDILARASRREANAPSVDVAAATRELLATFRGLMPPEGALAEEHRSEWCAFESLVARAAELGAAAQSGPDQEIVSEVLSEVRQSRYCLTDADQDREYLAANATANEQLARFDLGLARLESALQVPAPLVQRLSISIDEFLRENHPGAGVSGVGRGLASADDIVDSFDT